MTTAISSVSLSIFHDALIRANVEYMSRHLFGMPYSDVQKIIYPTPPYKVFLIQKRNGTPRVIQEPRIKLKELQLKVLAFLEENGGQPKVCVHGFTKKRSIVTNARQHCSKQTQHLLNIDLENFFPSISFFRVRGVFQKKPFSCSHSVATVLAHLCTHENELPQGAPTSPMLANLVCRRLDGDLMGLARRHRATYTRYADDITFSFSIRDAARLPENICSYASGALILGQELQNIITANNFQINPTKNRLSNRLHRLEVTGITINEFPNVKRIFIDRIRGALHAWDKHGYAKTQAQWRMLVLNGTEVSYERRPWRRQRRLPDLPELINVLWGKLLYVRMVRGGDDIIYTRLAERYNSLCRKEFDQDEEFLFSTLPIESIVRNAQDAELAVFVVEWTGNYHPDGVQDADLVGGQGTAFLYQTNNCLITCDHVLRYESNENGTHFITDYSSPDMKEPNLTVHNPASGATLNVKVVYRDQNRDLAILEFVDVPPLSRHFVGLDTAIKRNEKGYLIGFPNWNPGRAANQTEALVLNRFARRTFPRLEISTNIRKGNSGGPFVDELFRVAGVAQEGATQSDGNDECLCVDELNTWLSTWKAGLQLPK